MEAFHVEGPHISPEDGPRGAHPARWVRPPDFDEFLRWQDAARAMSGWSRCRRSGRARRAISSGSPTKASSSASDIRGATAQQIHDAVSAGATLSTHLGNARACVLAAPTNYIWDNWPKIAWPRVSSSTASSAGRVPAAALAAKGIERSILVTDAVMPAMCAPGPYALGGVEVELQEDERVVTLRGGERLAGSSLRMDQAIANVMRARE